MPKRIFQKIGLNVIINSLLAELPYEQRLGGTMRIRNNLIDQLEKEMDEFYYCLSIGLKSGEIVYIDGISKGEKNGYLNFAKHSQETMILEIDNSLWRIQAADIESISVKQYKKKNEKSYGWFNRNLIAKARFTKASFFFWIKWFVFLLIFSMFLAAFKIVLKGDVMAVLMDPSMIGNVLKEGLRYGDMAFFAILAIMAILFIIDFFLPITEPYRRIKPYPEYLSDNRLSNLIVILGFIMFYKVFSILLAGIRM